MQHSFNRHRGWLSFGRAVVALGLIAVVVLLGTLSRNAALHADFHELLEANHTGCAHSPAAHNDGPDEHGAEADCALCLFAHGQWLNVAPAPVVAELRLGLPLNAPPIPDSPATPVWFTPTLERGPPAWG